MHDPDPREVDAIQNGAAMGGEFMDELGKTDLADMTPEEWLTLCEVVVTGYVDRLQELASAAPPQ